MKKLVLVLLLLAARSALAQCPSATCYVDDTGAGNLYTEASPGLLEDLVDCSSGLLPYPGDTILVKAGTYTAGVTGNASKYVFRGACTGKAGQPIKLRRYGDEKVNFQCGVDLSNATFGKNDCVGVFSSSDGSVANITGASVTRVSGNTYITGTPWQNRVITIDPIDPDTTGPLPDPPPFSATISVVPSTTTMTLTASVSGGPYTNAKITNVASREYIEWWDTLIEHDTSTQTRFGSAGHVSVNQPTSPRVVTWIDGADNFEEGISPSATVGTNGTTVTWISGTKFCKSGCDGGVWFSNTGLGNKDIVINSVVYQVTGVSNIPAGCATDCTTLTISSSAGVQASTSARLPSRWANRDWLLNTVGPQDSGGSYSTYQLSWCADATHCTLRTAITEANGNYESLFASDSTIGDPPVQQSGIGMSCNGCKFINNYIFDWDGGTIIGGDAFNGGVEWYGNVMLYGGFPGTTRGAGHGYYIQNPPNFGEAGRTRYGGNLTLRPFCLMGQVYTESELTSYVTIDDNIFGANGHQKWPIATWPATGQTCASGGMWLGAQAVLGTGCAGTPNPNSNLKVATHDILDRNFYYNPTAAVLVWGSNKGACNSTVTDNYLIGTGAVTFTQNGMWGFHTNTGNTFMSASIPVTPAACCGGPDSPKFNRQDYNGNTYLEAVPTTDVTVANCPPPYSVVSGNCVSYEPNEKANGKGFAGVFNPDGDATVVVDLCSFGGFAGEFFDLFNGQCPNPWECTQLTVTGANINTTTNPAGSSGVITACPANATVSATLAAADIRRPAFTDKDGSTVFPKPPDLGPEFVSFSLERNFPSYSASTPTPTPSLTPTNTNTPTPTRTQTFTPSLTATRTSTNTQTRTATVTFTPSPTFTVGGPTVTNTFTPSSTATRTSTATITPTPSVTPSLTPSRTATPTATPLSVPVQGLSINPANCNIIAPMVVTTSADYPGTFVSSTDGDDGMVECPFTIGTAGVYYFHAKVLGESNLTDSFYFTIDDSDLVTSPCNTPEDTSCTQIFDVASDKSPLEGTEQCTLTHSWGTIGWHAWNNRGGGDGTCNGEGSHFSRELAVGTHTLRVRQRDLNTQLYYIKLSTDPNFEPVDPQPTPTPDFTGSGPTHQHPCGFKEGGKHWVTTHRHPPTQIEPNHTHEFCGPPVH